jgi:hypothetical protein
MPGTTGNIQWDWLDPKTVQLYNTDRGVSTTYESELQQRMLEEQARQLGNEDFFKSATGKMASDRDLEAAYQRSKEKAEDDRKHNEDENKYYNQATPPNDEDKAAWNKQIRAYDKYLRKEHGDRPEDGFSELLGTGAVWIGEDGGLWTNSGRLTQRQLGSLVQGWKQWAQQLESGDQFYRDDYNEILSTHRDWQKQIEDKVLQQGHSGGVDAPPSGGWKKFQE